MWDPADEEAARRRRQAQVAGEFGDPVHEAWVTELGPRAPSHTARAVVVVVVLATVVVSGILACALAVDLLDLLTSFTGQPAG